MAKAYSLDLRERVVRFVEAGHSRRAAAVYFGVSVSFAVYLMRAWRLRGSLAPQAAGGRRHAKLDPHRDFLLARLAEQADLTMPGLAGALEATTGTKVAPASLSRWLIRQGYRLKKNAAGQRTRSPGSPTSAPGVETRSAARDAAGAASAGLHR